MPGASGPGAAGPGLVAVRNLVLDALDLTLGFDLVRENVRLCPSVGPVPTVRSHMSPAADALVAAVHEGLRSAIELDDPKRVAAPLEEFWETYPDYHPHHTGRCYEHGHEENPYSSPLECQSSELQRLLSLYLPSGAGARPRRGH